MTEWGPAPEPKPIVFTEFDLRVMEASLKMQMEWNDKEN